jgi:hypothetical protein
VFRDLAILNLRDTEWSSYVHCFKIAIYGDVEGFDPAAPSFATQFGGWDVKASASAVPGATVNWELSAEIEPSATVSLVVSAL